MAINTVSSVQLHGKECNKTQSVSKENEQEQIFQTETEQTEDLSNKLFQEPKENEEAQGFWANLGSGLKSIDKYTFDILKYPFKKLSEKIDEKYAGAKLWEITKGLGDVADFILSTEGIVVMGATILTLKGITKGAKIIGGSKGEIITHQIIKSGFIGYGIAGSGEGILKAITSDTPEEAREAGEKIGTGALFISGGLKMKSNAPIISSDIKVPAERLMIKENTPFSELKTQVETLFNSLYDDLGIPKEARAKLEIIDNIKYKTKAEIEEIVLEKINGHKYYGQEKLDKIKIFDESDNPLEMSVEEIKAKIKTAVDKTPDAKLYDMDYYEILGDTKGSTGGEYSGGTNHKLTINLNTLRNGTFKSVEEVLVHEVEHSRNAILRHRLSAHDASQTIKEVLINRILNGEAEKIIVKGGFLGPVMMEAPKLSPKMKAEFIKFAKEKLYTDEAKNYLDDMSQMKIYKADVNSGKVTEKSKAAYEAAVEHFAEIQKWIDNTIKENPDFVEQYGRFKGNATEMLSKYVQSHLTRYKDFSNTKINNLEKVQFPELTPEEHAEAIKSLRGYIETIEGNARNQGLNSLFGVTKAQFNQYQFSYEEVLARNTAAKYEKAKLEAQPQTPETQARIEDLEFQLKYNEIGSRFYRLYTELLNHPEDAKLKSDLLKAQKEFEILDKQKENKALDYIFDFKIPYLSGLSGDAIYSTISNKGEK